MKTTHNTIQVIQQKLTSEFKPTQLDIVDNSHRHIGHIGHNGGGHYRLTIASKKFNNKSTLECHRMVYSALDELIRNNTIHALQITIT